METTALTNLNFQQERNDDMLRLRRKIKKQQEQLIAIEDENQRLKDKIALNDPHNVHQLLSGIKNELMPVIGFFNEAPTGAPTTKKRISKKERLRLEAEQEMIDFENHKQMLEQDSIQRVKNQKGLMK